MEKGGGGGVRRKSGVEKRGGMRRRGRVKKRGGVRMKMGGGRMRLLS